MVWIFKTSIRMQKDVKQVKPKLDEALMSEAVWNFDLEDRDNILRIEAASLKPQHIEELLAEAGYECVELD